MDRSKKKRLRDLIYHASHYLCVCRCIACEEIIAENEVMCEECRAAFDMGCFASCGICDMPLSTCLCAESSLEGSGIRRHVKLYRYDTNDHDAVGNRILYRLKVRNVATCFRFLGDRLAQTTQKLIAIDDSYLVSFIPRTPSRVLDYGHDQSKEIALEMSLVLDLPMEVLFKRSIHARTQKKLTSAQARKENIESGLSLKNDITDKVKGRRVLLVDDIVTSGASMRVAAKLLREAGAREVIAVSVAIVSRVKNLKTEAEKNSRLPYYMR